MVYAALSAGLIVAVLAVALATASPSLSVAEFAPAARQAIDTPPTTGDAQSAARGGRGRRATTTTTVSTAEGSASTAQPGATAPPTTRVGRSRQCVGNPPRQAEDPQSPPCVATIFEGDNGGATFTGVTASEIRVAIPLRPGEVGDKTRSAAYKVLFDYFNQRYEFYGRRLVPVFVEANISDPVSARAAAADIASRSVFGALTGTAEWAGGFSADPLIRALARAKVVTAVRGEGQWLSDRTLYDELHPYVWSVFVSAEELERNIASFACSALVGRPAQHSPDPERRSQTRKFGVVVSARYAAPVTAPLIDGLRGCGADVSRFDVNTQNSSSDAVRNGFDRFAADGVTTVACLGESLDCRGYLTSYGNNRFEWLITTANSINSDGNWRCCGLLEKPPAMFGVQEWGKVLPTQVMPYAQAVLTMRPDLGTSAADSLEQFFIMGTATTAYPSLLLLAAGIQGAGPNLTPDSFAAGLMSMQFPNSGAGQAPYWQPAAGFGPGDHSLNDDFAVAWWSGSAEAYSYQTGAPGLGSFCYLDRGARYSAGSYPTDADQRVFNPAEPCR